MSDVNSTKRKGVDMCVEGGSEYSGIECVGRREVVSSYDVQYRDAMQVRICAAAEVFVGSHLLSFSMSRLALRLMAEERQFLQQQSAFEAAEEQRSDDERKRLQEEERQWWEDENRASIEGAALLRASMEAENRELRTSRLGNRSQIVPVWFYLSSPRPCPCPCPCTRPSLPLPLSVPLPVPLPVPHSLSVSSPSPFVSVSVSVSHSSSLP